MSHITAIHQSADPSSKELLHEGNLQLFIYNDVAYARVIPSKRLFNSTMVHEVVNRGDVFAMRLSDQVLCIVPGTAAVKHTKASVAWWQEPVAQQSLGLNSESI